jgi:hypothetical protein
MTVHKQDDGSYHCNVHNCGPAGNFTIRVERDCVQIFDEDNVLEGTIPLDMPAAPLIPGGSAPGSPPAEPLSLSFKLATGGADNEFDALGILCKVVAPLDPNQRRRVIAYLAQRFDHVAP